MAAVRARWEKRRPGPTSHPTLNGSVRADYMVRCAGRSASPPQSQSYSQPTDAIIEVVELPTCLRQIRLFLADVAALTNNYVANSIQLLTGEVHLANRILALAMQMH